jgi:hypothetical protein
MVAVGCEEGVWVGFHQDFGGETSGFNTLTCVDSLCSPAMRRMLHLKMVSQCATFRVGNFGIFLVLAGKVHRIL